MRVQVYPTPHPDAPMSVPEWRSRAVMAEARLGWDHPASQAARGRLQAAGGPPVPEPVGVDSPGGRAIMRALLLPGACNRRYRRAVKARAALKQ